MESDYRNATESWLVSVKIRKEMNLFLRFWKYLFSTVAGLGGREQKSQVLCLQALLGWHCYTHHSTTSANLPSKAIPGAGKALHCSSSALQKPSETSRAPLIVLLVSKGKQDVLLNTHWSSLKVFGMLKKVTWGSSVKASIHRGPVCGDPDPWGSTGLCLNTINMQLCYKDATGLQCFLLSKTN